MREIVEKKVLSENDRLTAVLRQRYRDENILCVNFISSPGSGKTALLEKTLASFSKDASVAVLTGDLQTDNDARRLARAMAFRCGRLSPAERVISMRAWSKSISTKWDFVGPACYW
jgi:Ni2+-binding GTPase involved in maturation of urease and hydrogenase